MSSRFESILAEVEQLTKGEMQGACVHRVCVNEVKTFTPEEIKQIRLRANMTQGIFAACIGVTPKAVEGWEGGRSKPDGAARRTIGLMQNNPRYADEAGIIIR